MQKILEENGWFSNMFDDELWGNLIESGFWRYRDAFEQIDRINEIKKTKEQGWKFIPGED